MEQESISKTTLEEIEKDLFDDDLFDTTKGRHTKYFAFINSCLSSIT